MKDSGYDHSSTVITRRALHRHAAPAGAEDGALHPEPQQLRVRLGARHHRHPSRHRAAAAAHVARRRADDYMLLQRGRIGDAIQIFQLNVEEYPNNWNEQPAVTVDAATLDKYIGTYALAAGFNLAITREGHKLFAQATGQWRVPGESLSAAKAVRSTSASAARNGRGRGNPSIRRSACIRAVRKAVARAD